MEIDYERLDRIKKKQARKEKAFLVAKEIAASEMLDGMDVPKIVKLAYQLVDEIERQGNE